MHCQFLARIYKELNSCIYLSVRLCIEASWLNDRDQFLFPNDGWKGDPGFAGYCLVYALSHGQNGISSAVTNECGVAGVRALLEHCT